MLDLLRRDYDATAAMIFGEVPSFGTVLESLAGAEERLCPNAKTCTVPG
jgi:hypothetical protein